MDARERWSPIVGAAAVMVSRLSTPWVEEIQGTKHSTNLQVLMPLTTAPLSMGSWPSSSGSANTDP